MKFNSGRIRNARVVYPPKKDFIPIRNNILIAAPPLNLGGAGISMVGFAKHLGKYRFVKLIHVDPGGTDLSEIVRSFRPLTIIGKAPEGYQSLLKLNRREYPGLRFIFISADLTINQDIELVDQLDLKESRPHIVECLKHADLVVPHSDLVMQIYKRTFGNSVRLSPVPIYTCLFTCDPPMEVPSFASRPIDILAVANSWARQEKNKLFLNQIFDQFKSLQCVRLGSNTSEIENFRPHQSVLETMRRSKVLVIPSKVDVSPNVLVEGLMMGANVVGSKNIGTASFLAPEFICDRCDLEQFSSRINLGLKKLHKHGLPTREKILTNFLTFC